MNNKLKKIFINIKLGFIIGHSLKTLKQYTLNFFIGDIGSIFFDHVGKDKYSDFPLNLLPELNIIINVELLYIYILINMYLVNLLIKFNYKKYIPNNRIGKILEYFIESYINL